MTFSLNSKKPFLAHFPNIWRKNSFFKKNPALSHTTPKGVLAPCCNSEKSNYLIPIKHLENTPLSQDPFTYHQGFKKHNCSRLTFKSQRY